MNKKLMAAAVAGVLVAPAAFAQSSNVQLYGRINGGLDYYKAPGATIGGVGAATDSSRDGRFRVFDNSSRVGLRGTDGTSVEVADRVALGLVGDDHEVPVLPVRTGGRL